VSLHGVISQGLGPTEVQWGESTDDEMCINWVRSYPKGALHCARMNAMSSSQ